MSDLLVTRRGRVAVLTLNRPQHGNRLTTALAQNVAAALTLARDDVAVGACVLTGAGDVFCLGGDYRGAGRAGCLRAKRSKRPSELCWPPSAQSTPNASSTLPGIPPLRG
jgi:enoyl-CoA hydratase/carnithine racemase